MREIVTVEQMDRLFLGLAVAAPVVGAAVGGFMARGSSAGRGALKGLLVGLLGLVNLGLWKVYNVLTDRMGLDTVKNLLVQLGLFVTLGVVAGLVGGWIMRRNPPATGQGDMDGGLSPVAAGGPTSGSPGTASTFDDAEEPPRDA